MRERFFASDNAAPVHPAVLEAIILANTGHAGAYGNDEETAAGLHALQTVFPAAEGVFLVYNGTGANTIALRAMVPQYGATICTEVSHINRDEAGSVQAAGAGRLLTAAGTDGKLFPEDIKFFLGDVGVEHHSQPTAVSITQPTELGTVYSRSELAAIVACCREHKLLLHMDGARLANACVSLDCSPADMVQGVDVLAFGGTKNGMMFGEALIVQNSRAAAELKFHRKQLAQLHSKMRYISVQFSALLQHNLYLQNASHANLMAQRLCNGIQAVRNTAVSIAYPVQANAVFAVLPEKAAAVLQQEWPFYEWKSGMYRLMCSYDTQPEDVDSFLEVLEKELR